MSASQIVPGPQKRRRGVKPQKGPVSKIARLIGISVVELAKEIDENYQSMRTWNKRGHVPDDVAKKLEAAVAARRQPTA